MENTVTESTLIYDVLCMAQEKDVSEEIQQIFFDMGMHCLGCPISRGETVGEAAEVHGNDVTELLAKINGLLA